MMNRYKSITIFLAVSAINITACYCQDCNDASIIDSITLQVKVLTGHDYHIAGIDVDYANHTPSLKNKIKDPYHTLKGCFIFIAEAVEDTIPIQPKGFIGIYKKSANNILWNSNLLSTNFTSEFSSGTAGGVEVTDELNQDGKVEIIIWQQWDNGGQYWIFNWNGKNGNLITQLDHSGESVILFGGDGYELIDIDGDGIYEIQGLTLNSIDKTVIYSWNGKLYGNWGKSSKYLLKGKDK
jgi:hypothetical protein